jgi:alpha-mannosidase
MSETGYGVALLNDSKYGHDVHRGALRLTLLRASNFPDPDADRGDHRFTYSLLPHLGSCVQSTVVAEAARLNQPVVAIASTNAASVSTAGAVASSNPAVVITAVKQAQDGSGDMVLRCYESTGGRASARLTTAFAASHVVVCDFLERALPEMADAASFDGTTISLNLKPFQIVTLRLSN